MKGTFNYTESAIFEQVFQRRDLEMGLKPRHNLLKVKGIPVESGCPLYT
jgi:hypothetical protein